MTKLNRWGQWRQKAKSFFPKGDTPQNRALADVAKLKASLVELKEKANSLPPEKAPTLYKPLSNLIEQSNTIQLKLRIDPGDQQLRAKFAQQFGELDRLNIEAELAITASWQKENDQR